VPGAGRAVNIGIPLRERADTYHRWDRLIAGTVWL